MKVTLRQINLAGQVLRVPEKTLGVHAGANFRFATVITEFERFLKTQDELIKKHDADDDGRVDDDQLDEYTKEREELLEEVIDIKFKPVQISMLEHAKNLTAADMYALSPFIKGEK